MDSNDLESEGDCAPEGLGSEEVGAPGGLPQVEVVDHHEGAHEEGGHAGEKELVPVRSGKHEGWG